MIKFKEGVLISKAINYVLWGTENPSPMDKSIGRQYKDKKLKKKIDEFINKWKK